MNLDPQFADQIPSRSSSDFIQACLPWVRHWRGLMKEIAENHGGLYANSKDEGAFFTIILPEESTEPIK
jgi:hypothetical protein